MRVATRHRLFGALCLVIILMTAVLAHAVFIEAKFFSAESATDTNTAVSFGFNGYVLMVNDGPNAVHVSLVGMTATTDDFQLKSGESLAPLDPTTGVGLICATAETATVRILALERGL